MPGHEIDDVINQRLNLYDVLELPTPLDAQSLYDDLPLIKRKYRSLALKYHPDKHPNDPLVIHKFHLLSTATNILTNTDVRPHYDRWLIDYQRKINDVERNKLIQKLELSESSTASAAHPHADLSHIQRFGELLRKLKHFNMSYGDWKHLDQKDQKNASHHPYYDCSTLRIVLENFPHSHAKSSCFAHLRNRIFTTLNPDEIHDIYFSERNNYSKDDSIIIYTVFDSPITAQHVFRSWSSGNVIPTVQDISPLIPLHYYSDFNLKTELNDDIARLVSNEPILLE
ncbi:Cwc23p [Saccharomyces cerevisiae x Saccharomyces kudriavzevii VIN7]|uniref:Cwc23p n=1 Tax=Saccharomyces cerevisiae x Saccharomyces kudriavzevii (strain VIN7) TaxID=1095631 RepID=H0GUP3_SACCK|nr:Cwc23p [Saccharomyces cerevisiae x Saccharomyces kudriavzevii VIN7]